MMLFRVVRSQYNTLKNCRTKKWYCCSVTSKVLDVICC